MHNHPLLNAIGNFSATIISETCDLNCSRGRLQNKREKVGTSFIKNHQTILLRAEMLRALTAVCQTTDSRWKHTNGEQPKLVWASVSPLNKGLDGARGVGHPQTTQQTASCPSAPLVVDVSLALRRVPPESGRRQRRDLRADIILQLCPTFQGARVHTSTRPDSNKARGWGEGERKDNEMLRPFAPKTFV